MYIYTCVYFIDELCIGIYNTEIITACHESYTVSYIYPTCSDTHNVIVKIF